MLTQPRGGGTPVVFDSPHSGFKYPADFRPAATRAQVLATWDAHVDTLWRDVPSAGATLLTALFPRAYVDPNRAENDIDPELIDAPWPTPAEPSDYTRRGMGVVRRCAGPGVALYGRLLSLAEVRRRIARYYVPYRRALRETLDRVWRREGAVWHFNCHSMKSAGRAPGAARAVRRPDFAIGDRGGTTAPRALTAWVAGFFARRGYTVQIDRPYRGGDIVRTHGEPARRRYSIQIEINRALYMDETSFKRTVRFASLQRDLTAFARAVAALACAQVSGDSRGVRGAKV